MNSIITDAPPIIVTTLLLAGVVVLTFYYLRSRKTLNGTSSVVWMFIFQIGGLGWFSIWFWHSLAAGKIGKYIASWHNQFFITKITQYLTTLLVDWIVALILLFILWLIFLKHGKGLFLDQRDVIAFTIGTIAVGWPSVFIFLAMTFCITILGMLTLLMFKKKSLSDRLVVTPFIIPAAILTLFLGPYFLALTHLDKIRF